MVANAEITPGEAAHQAKLAGVQATFQPPAAPAPAAAAEAPPAAAPAAPAAPADTAPYVAPPPDASRGAPAGMPTLDQFMNQFSKEHTKAKPRTDQSFLQMNQATFDLKDLLGALSGGAAPAPAASAADAVGWQPQDDAALLGLTPPAQAAAPAVVPAPALVPAPAVVAAPLVAAAPVLATAPAA